MTAPVRKIEVDEATAALLEVRAWARGLTVSQLLMELAGEAAETLPDDLARLRDAGEGPWSAEALAEGARRLAEFQSTRNGAPWAEVSAWIRSWGADDELPPPKPRRV
jgi:hypothetical protein